MNPAPSIVLFTTLSGAGYGLLFALGLAGGLGLFAGAGVLAPVFGLGLALAAITAGLLASTFHLGRPDRAWRALSQWRSSWLSREGVAAVATYGPALLFAMDWFFSGKPSALLGLAAAAGAVATVFCTAMIYHQLQTIPRWRHPLTPICFLAFAAQIGVAAAFALALASDVGAGAMALGFVALALGLAAWWAKSRWWVETDRAGLGLSAGAMLGLGDEVAITQLEPPHRGENWVTHEMAFALARKHRDALRVWAVRLGLAGPTAGLVLALLINDGILATTCACLAALSALAATMVERWLFFAEARHVVSLYYGATAA